MGALGLRVDFLGAGEPRTTSDQAILLFVLSELVAVKGYFFLYRLELQFSPKKFFLSFLVLYTEADLPLLSVRRGKA